MVPALNKKLAMSNGQVNIKKRDSKHRLHYTIRSHDRMKLGIFLSMGCPPIVSSAHVEQNDSEELMKTKNEENVRWIICRTELGGEKMLWD